MTKNLTDTSAHPAEVTLESDLAEQEAIIGEDGLGRCPWATGHPTNLHYHDTEWGMPVRGEQALYERIGLEAFRAGLSWLTILIKRPASRGRRSLYDALVEPHVLVRAAFP
jgi:DNA-3-methyladenine glycosylase I